MKTILICPVHRPAVARLAQNEPLVLVPLLGKCLLDYWLEHLVDQGERAVRIIALDRPEQVRARVGDGSRWGLRLEVLSFDDTSTRSAPEHQNPTTSNEGVPPEHVIITDHLPGLPGVPLFESYVTWFEALLSWIPFAANTPDRIGRKEIKPGVTVGLHSRISPSAQLHAPCWIGDNVVVGSDAIIGPGVILEDRAFVGPGASVTQSIVGPETFVGEMTLVERSLACGHLLINWKTRSCLEVPDAFLLSSLRTGQPASRTPARVNSPLVSLRNLIPRQLG